MPQAAMEVPVTCTYMHVNDQLYLSEAMIFENIDPEKRHSEAVVFVLGDSDRTAIWSQCQDMPLKR